jgi:hypothetical protein
MKRRRAALVIGLVIGLCGTGLTAPVAPNIVLVTPNPALGQYAQFAAVGPSNVLAHARVLVSCFQPVPFDYVDGNGVTRTQTDPLVYGSGQSLAEATNPGDLLGGGASVWLWHGGEADCIAQLFEFKQVKGQQTFILHAQTAFHAAG